MVESIEITRSKDGAGWIAMAKIAPNSPLRFASGISGGSTDAGPWVKSDEAYSPEAALEQVMTKIGRAAARVLVVPPSEPTPAPAPDEKEG